MTISAEVPGQELTETVATAHADKIQEIHTLMTDRLRQARQHMGRYYDARRQPIEFETGDIVWLKTDNIRTRRTCKKLDHRKVGPFEITERIGPLAYRLDLPDTLPIHNVFHIENLEKASKPTIQGQRPYPQGPLEAIPDKEWDVEAIVDSRVSPQGHLEYKVNWAGDFGDTWEPIKNLQCPEKVQAFHASNPERLRPEAREFSPDITVDSLSDASETSDDPESSPDSDYEDDDVTSL